jgi:hypothetical protein
MKVIFKALTVFFCAFVAQISAASHVVMTASNDPNNNMLLVYDAKGSILQSVPTQGKGGVAPNIVAGGIAKSGNALAVINYGSQTVSLFRLQEGEPIFVQQIETLSKPVSVTFGNNHLYILGTNTIQSHMLNQGSANPNPDGSSKLLVGDGSAAQVGFLQNQLIISERSNMIELVELQGGAVTQSIKPVQLPPPPKNKTPVGLATRGTTAFVTIAHSDLVGLVKNGSLEKVVSTESQHAPCWLTLAGPWLFSSNTPSKSISRFDVTENSLTLAQLIAVQTQGEPTDIDAQNGILAVLESSNNTMKISQFQIDNQGNLQLINSNPTSNTANGIAVISLQ